MMNFIPVLWSIASPGNPPYWTAAGQVSSLGVVDGQSFEPGTVAGQINGDTE